MKKNKSILLHAVTLGTFFTNSIFGMERKEKIDTESNVSQTAPLLLESFAKSLAKREAGEGNEDIHNYHISKDVYDHCILPQIQQILNRTTALKQLRIIDLAIKPVDNVLNFLRKAKEYNVLVTLKLINPTNEHLEKIMNNANSSQIRHLHIERDSVVLPGFEAPQDSLKAEAGKHEIEKKHIRIKDKDLLSIKFQNQSKKPAKTSQQDIKSLLTLNIKDFFKRQRVPVVDVADQRNKLVWEVERVDVPVQPPVDDGAEADHPVAPVIAVNLVEENVQPQEPLNELAEAAQVEEPIVEVNLVEENVQPQEPLNELAEAAQVEGPVVEVNLVEENVQPQEPLNELAEAAQGEEPIVEVNLVEGNVQPQEPLNEAGEPVLKMNPPFFEANNYVLPAVAKSEASNPVYPAENKIKKPGQKVLESPVDLLPLRNWGMSRKSQAKENNNPVASQPVMMRTGSDYYQNHSTPINLIRIFCR